jgi:hypothetical protein
MAIGGRRESDAITGAARAMAAAPRSLGPV